MNSTKIIIKKKIHLARMLLCRNMLVLKHLNNNILKIYDKIILNFLEEKKKIKVKILKILKRARSHH